jgi:hypothetical protein
MVILYLIVGICHKAYRRLLWATLRVPERRGPEHAGSMTIIEG